MRNISYDTTEEEFKEFMEKFGQIKYAVLCKVKELQLNQENGGMAQTPTHKGTGFVQFKETQVAE